MDKAELYCSIQKYMSDKPLILTGTGASIPLGIPGMGELARHLLTRLDSIYSTDKDWITISEELRKGTDLESAVANLMLSQELQNDIRKETWNLVTEHDLLVFSETILDRTKKLPLARLLLYFYRAHPNCINVVTTNYDRTIEYACDFANIPCRTGFEGIYCKSCDLNNFQQTKSVNILKVHGSLDTFCNSSNITVSIPIQPAIPANCLPEIVIPGQSKYKAVLLGPCRDLLHKSDELISQASAFLCIGYGFNDEQIQESIIVQIRKGKKIVIITKKLSSNAIMLIRTNALKYIVIEEGPDPNSSHIFTNGDDFVIDQDIWTIDGFANIFE